LASAQFQEIPKKYATEQCQKFAIVTSYVNSKLNRALMPGSSQQAAVAHQIFGDSAKHKRCKHVLLSSKTSLKAHQQQQHTVTRIVTSPLEHYCIQWEPKSPHWRSAGTQRASFFTKRFPAHCMTHPQTCFGHKINVQDSYAQ
jgi:hypothetical protein